ncbi:MAG: hypothetical protein V7636_302 [Actinomycetota bacterium]|jgi:hypothetical protein
MDPVIARKTFRTLEPLHGFVYFSPDAEPEYVAVGLKPGRMGYFASRSAPMGAVAAEVVIATFFNFNHELVRSVIPSAWHEATPEMCWPRACASPISGCDGCSAMPSSHRS